MMSAGGMGGRGLALFLIHYVRAKYRRQWSGREALERWQERQVQRSLRFVRKHSPFYRELWGGRPLTEWREFPVIDKAVMMEHFDRLNTAGIRKEEAMELALEAERTRNFTPQLWHNSHPPCPATLLDEAPHGYKGRRVRSIAHLLSTRLSFRAPSG